MQAELGESDMRLVSEARAVIGRMYLKGRHHVGAALLSTGGDVYTAVHVEANVGRIALCAEAVAIGEMRSRSRDMVDTIVAVISPGEDAASQDVYVVSPCGMCRELISDYGPGASVIIERDGRLVKVSVESLLPDKFESRD